MRGILQMTRLGRMGRAGNAFMQYAFLRSYCHRHDLQLQVPPWFGELLFGFKDARPTRPMRVVEEKMVHAIDDTIIPHLRMPLCDVDVCGFFQYHTSCFAPDREFIQDVFANPVDAVKERLAPAIEKLRSLAPEIIGVHIRRGDFGQCAFYLTPIEWYTKLLDEIVGRDNAVFIASDSPEVFEAFAKYKPVTAESLGIKLSDVPMPGAAHLAKDLRDKNATALDFFPDWELFRQCSMMLIPNSTFSFTAAMLSRNCKRVYRSDPDTLKFEPIDPWNAMPSQFIQQKDYEHIPGLYLKSCSYWNG